MKEAQALLAPVPARHIESGDDVCRVHGSVIFGSDRWGLFEDQGVRDGAPVYLYASMAGGKGAPTVTWQGEFARVIRKEDLTSEDRRRRPPTTDQPGETAWAVYWEVRNLRRLEDPFPVSDLSRADGRRLSLVFIPHGPLAVAG